MSELVKAAVQALVSAVFETVFRPDLTTDEKVSRVKPGVEKVGYPMYGLFYHKVYVKRYSK